MEKTTNGKMDRSESEPSCKGQNMDRDNWRESYINDPMPGNRKHDESQNKEDAEWPMSKLHEKSTNAPDSD